MKRFSKILIPILVIGFIAAVIFIPLWITKSYIPQREAEYVLGSPPSQIGEMPLRHFIQGEEALASINKLHGKRITLKDGVVAHYEKNGTVAMLWIGLAGSTGQAKALVNRMERKIKAGSKVFGYLKQFKAQGMQVHQLTGMGQNHYIYQRSNKVIWLSVDPLVATEILKDTIAVVK